MRFFRTTPNSGQNRTVRRRQALCVAVAISSASLGLVGLGGGFAAAGGAQAHASVPASLLSTLKARIKAAEAAPAFTAPGPKVNASVVKGKSVLVMPVNSEIGACQTQTQDFATLAKKLGMKVTTFSDSGVPTQWEQGVQEATADKDAAIVLICGIVPQAIGPQLVAAEKAGAVVVDGNYNEVSDYTDLDGETAVNTAQSMHNDVDDAIVNLNGKPLHALLVSTDSIVQGPAAQAAVVSEVKKDCPTTCSVAAKVIVPIQNWATSIQTDVNSALVANPDINAVIVNFDGMTQFVLPSVEQAHRAGLRIYTWGASNTVEEQLTSEKAYVAADPGPDEQWDAYESMDQVIRLLGHHPAASVNKEVDPDRFWVEGNVSAFFSANHGYGNEGYGGNAFIKGFDSLWGI